MSRIMVTGCLFMLVVLPACASKRGDPVPVEVAPVVDTSCRDALMLQRDLSADRRFKPQQTIYLLETGESCRF